VAEKEGKEKKSEVPSAAGFERLWLRGKKSIKGGNWGGEGKKRALVTNGAREGPCRAAQKRNGFGLAFRTVSKKAHLIMIGGRKEEQQSTRMKGKRGKKRRRTTMGEGGIKRVAAGLSTHLNHEERKKETLWNLIPGKETPVTPEGEKADRWRKGSGNDFSRKGGPEAAMGGKKG